MSLALMIIPFSVVPCILGRVCVYGYSFVSVSFTIEMLNWYFAEDALDLPEENRKGEGNRIL